MPETTHAPERWLPVPGYEGSYDVSDQGRVRSWLTWRGQPGPRLLSPTPDSSGHLQTRLSKAGWATQYRVHSLVLLAFVGPRPDGLETRHLDGSRTNNHLANLVYGTAAENHLDKVRHGTHPMASKTECKRGHPFDEENTYVMSSGRSCRACGRERSRQYKLAKNSQ